MADLFRVGVIRGFRQKVVPVRKFLDPTPRLSEIGKRMVDRIPRSRWVMNVWIATKSQIYEGMSKEVE